MDVRRTSARYSARRRQARERKRIERPARRDFRPCELFVLSKAERTSIKKRLHLIKWTYLIRFQSRLLESDLNERSVVIALSSERHYIGNVTIVK